MYFFLTTALFVSVEHDVGLEWLISKWQCSYRGLDSSFLADAGICFQDLKYPRSRPNESSAISVHKALSPHLFSPGVLFKEREKNDEIHKLRKDS